MKTVSERLWAKIDTSGGPDACWPWLAGLSTTGYGQLKVDGHQVKATRLVYEETFGPIPTPQDYHGLCVCHTCDNRTCCNPRHFFLGSHTDNMADKARKGRQHRPAGELHGNAKLTTAKVEALRAFMWDGVVSKAELARLFGVSPSLIGLVLAGKGWAHVG